MKKSFKQFCLLLFCCSLLIGVNAQTTPPDANTDVECGEDCWDLFSWNRVQDGSGTNIPNFSEGTANDANCNTTIVATAEYTGADSNGPDLIGTAIGANFQGTSTDSWLIGFGEPLTNPVINLSALESTTDVLITDCDGNEITANCISSCGANLTYVAGVGWSGDFAYSLQLVGTYECINISFDIIVNDAYSFSIGTCLGANPLPPCVDCGPDEDFEYINLVNKSGSGTGATADVELDNVLVGNAEVLFSDLDINEDLAGTTFGGFDNDGGTYLLKLEFCEPITIQQFDIINLEVESEVSIGTTISGSGPTATLGGATMTQCGGSNRMSLNDGAPNLVITDGPGCGANPNAKYTLGAITTDVLYFKYRNPEGGCSFDYVGFKIGTCVSDGVDAVPVCPLEYLTYATDIEDYVTNGPDFIGNDANAFQVMRDANGNFFNQNCTQIQNEVENMIAIPTVPISPCAELVDVEECTFCDPPPPCNECPAGTDNRFISLDKTGETPAGLDMGLVEINGVCVGQYEFLFDDLDINTDGNGTTFGGFDNDGGTMILQIDFCDPLMVNQLDVRNLEVMSQVSVGTTISGTGASATLGGQTLTFCEGSDRMDADDITNGNLITTAGPGCGANPNASYTFGTNPVSTLYFKYYNPDGGCRYDYVGFRVATCVTPPPMAVPVCPLETVRVTCDMDAVIANNGNATNANSDEYVVDGNGNYFDFQTCSATALRNALDNGTMLQTVNIGCAELVETTEECVVEDCIITPTCTATTCPDNTSFEYISLDADGTNDAGLPMGTIDLDNVKVGTYEFVFSDLDVSEDGNGTTFGGWDNDGGTMLLRLDFCEPMVIQEFDIRNLEVGSEVSIGNATTSMDAAARLFGLTLTNCSDPSGRMGVGPAANEVITDGPGCGANPNATYTIAPSNVMTLFIKYHNPPSDGTFPSRCRGDYVGFRIGVCAPEPVMAMPTCPLNLYTVDDCPDDPSNATVNYYQDANGNWFPANICTDPVDEMTAIETIQISPCASTTFVELCAFCCELEVTCPPTDLGTITCNDAVPTAATTEAEFEALGGDIADDPGFCGTLVITHTDVFNPPMDICNGRTLTRTYTIADDMTSMECVQTLNISAPNGPTITCPADRTVECFADIMVNPDDATVTTDCSQGSNTVITGPVQSGDSDCPATTYTYTYTVTDDCGRTASCEQIFTIQNDGPTITCPADMIVECFADITVDPNDAVVVTSCTLGFNTVVTGPVTVGQADCPGTTHTYTYTTTDDCGRTASCEQVFTIENLAPIVVCPADEVVTCFEDIVADPANLTVTTACGLGFVSYVKQPLITGGIPGCDGTVYTYIYKVIDDCGRVSQCEQQFMIQNNAPTVTVAAGETVTCFEDIEVAPSDATVTTDCEGDYTLTILPVVINGPENCTGTTYTYTYRVKDFCNRIVEVDRVFTISNTVGPIITSIPLDMTSECGGGPSLQQFKAESSCGEDVETSVSDPTVIGTPGCSGSRIQYTYTATDACGRTATHVQTITIQNDGPVLECPETLQIFNCEDGDNNALIESWIASVTATAACGGSIEVRDNYNGNAGMCINNGFTNVTFFATDQCGRTTSCVGTIIMVDTEAPIIFEQPQEVLVPCNGATQFIFDNWLATQGGAQAIDACWGNNITWSMNPSNPQLNCEGGPQAIVVEFIARDGCGNTASVTGVFNTKVQPEFVNISGQIHREDMEGVSDVQIGIEGGSAGLPDMDYTEDAGTYGLPELEYEDELRVVPHKDSDPLNGVSTFDLLLLQKHILSIETLDSPYKLIAADINNSGHISTFDMIYLRRLVLFIDEGFQNNTSWRFVDADFVFANPANPFEASFPEVYMLEGLEQEEANFVGVKIGDLNLDALSNATAVAADRSDLDNLTLEVKDELLKSEVEHRINFTVQNFEQIDGFQFTLNFDESVVNTVNVESADLNHFDENNYGLSKVEQGAITVSWNHNTVQDLQTDEVIFSLLMTTNSDVQLSDVLSISSEYTRAEAYQNSELMNVNLAFNKDGIISQADEFKLFQNQPNPFKEATMIGFNLPEAGAVSLNIYDVSGKLIYTQEGDFAKGYNQFNLDRSNLPEGILYYHVTTENDADSKKMILLD